MNEFCVNRLNVPTTINESAKRPKCSVSPIDNHTNAVSDESYLHNSTNLSVISPFVNKVQPKYTAPTLQTSLYDSVLQENVNTSNALFNTSSPYYLNKNSSKSMSKNLFVKNLNDNYIKPIQFQSTPNKTQKSSLQIPSQSNRVNFHSILDLAKSDEQKPASTVINESNEPTSFNSSGYNSSALSLNNSNTANNSSLINFNEHLKFLSMSCNKENSKMEFLSKVCFQLYSLLNIKINKFYFIE